MRYPKALLILLLLSLPICAHADAGTPLMWVGFLHLTIGNLIIGIAEGLLLAWIFKLKWGKCVLYLIAANYFSMICGIFLRESLATILRFFAPWAISSRENLDIYNIWSYLKIMVLVTYICTLILEWPFFALSFFRTKHWFRKSLVATLIIQTASYLVVFGWYLSAMNLTLHRQVDIVSPYQITMPQGVQMYYISEKDGAVYLRDLKINTEKKVCDLPSRKPYYHLIGRVSNPTSSGVDIVAVLDWATTSSNAVVVQKDVPCTTTLEGIREYWRIIKLGEAQNSQWTYNFSDFGGIWGENRQEQYVPFVVETPFCSWRPLHPVQIPGDMVLYQLGDRQICIFDAPNRKIAVIAYGNGPLAVIPTNK